jgi:hypothetical protein
MEPREDLISASRFHRIIRRGRQYGAVIGRESALQDEAFTSGIYIISLNANISRQFEFIQYANSKFSGMVGDRQLRRVSGRSSHGRG